MKKLYRKRRIHPSHQSSVISDQYLSLLPATILTLTVTLSVEDREVLAYLISCSAITSSSSSSSSVVTLYSNRSNNNNNTVHQKSYSRSKDHPVLFNCNCFRCYMSYWVRWDSSSNRQLIHEIIDAYEDELTLSQTKKKVIQRRKDGRSKKGFHGSNCFDDLNSLEERKMISTGNEMVSGELKSMEETEEEDDDDESESGSIRIFMNFLVSKILTAWNQ